MELSNSFINEMYCSAVCVCGRYKARVNRYADMWRDERHSAIDEAVYWMELLIKGNGW